MWPFDILKRRRQRAREEFDMLHRAAERAGLTYRRTVGNHKVLIIQPPSEEFRRAHRHQAAAARDPQAPAQEDR